MFLGTNLINQKLSGKIAIIVTILVTIPIIIFLVFYLSFTEKYLILIPIFPLFIFFIVKSVTNYFLNPLNNIIKVLSDLKTSTSKINIKLNNKDWTELESELNDLIQKFNSDIYRIEKLGNSRTQFLGNVSHELKTPIFTIKGYIETLLDGGIDDKTVNRNFLKKIQSQTYRIETIFTDLIDITRIETGELKMDFDWFNFNELIYWTKESFEHIAIERGLILSLPDSINYEIFADKNRIQTVFSNLFTNAINYSDSGTIRLSAKIEQDKLMVKVMDNGIGITEENQKRIFERFFREDPNRSRKTGGSGLGLAIVKHILDAHKSRINLYSQKNVGTTFSFALPCRSVKY